ncbi:DUF4303 domain-containing protein [Clostridium sp. P21]|uniref:DUF4303 domain-containing protein n=1 Tax=Clostridium muellerianum TaxID=2716538 RepID=A0A7Y0HLY3_9CLOT|nr:hypothetical protein [Clostridium muellerianum]NMM62444.1 DUF4303 domain-containing protein [Clostridium muellerianum]
MEVNYSELKKKIVEFAKIEVLNFLKQNPGNTYKAFGFDVSGFYGTINLCLETEEHFDSAFEKAFKNYDNISSLAKKLMNREDNALNSAYIPVEWSHADFASENYAENDYFGEGKYEILMEDEDWSFKLLNIFSQALIEFLDTEEYHLIPKARDFKVVCMDFDEANVRESAERMLMISSNPVFKIFNCKD